MSEFDKTNDRVEVYDVIPYAPRRRQKNSFARATAAACLVAVLGGSSLGLGLSAGNMLFSAYKEPVAAAEEQPDITFTGTAATTIALTGSNNSVVTVVKETSDSVVSINVTGTARSFFNQLSLVQSAGSGIIVGEDSDKLYIATNNHVIDGANSVTISVDDSKQVEANYVGSDYQADLAVISVTKAAMQEAGVTGYKIAELGDSSKIEVGEVVVAIGNAAGEGKTATMGIVSAKEKEINIEGRMLQVLQTDAAINPGNSGGALVNMQGRIIGINTAKLSETGVEGMGYSIPINEAKTIIDQLLTKGTVQRPYLGIQGIDVDEQIKKRYGLPSVGVYVDSVSANSGAADGGLKVGDIIVGFGDTKITDMDELTEAIAASTVGDSIELSIYRGNQQQQLSVTMKDLNKKF